MKVLRRVCVFCGSHPGGDPHYLAAATELGTGLAEQGVGVVYGGAQVGLMGAVANAALAAGGEVIGVMPAFLGTAERRHTGLSALHVVDTMHARKAMMAELADAFIALPGGFGTLDELFEIVTWAFLRLHHKPVGLLNTLGYYDALQQFLQRGVDAGFMSAEQVALMQVHTSATTLLARLGVPQGRLAGRRPRRADTLSLRVAQ